MTDITLEEAKEIMEKEWEDTFVGSKRKWKAAVKLVIPALSQRITLKNATPARLYKPLPGEALEEGSIDDG